MYRRRLPMGAEPVPGGGTHFRVWTPHAHTVEVVRADGGTAPLQREQAGYHAGLLPRVLTGADYHFRLDGGESYPDPASRFQPDGPHGPSRVIDPLQFPWTDADWTGPPDGRQILYELHVGTFTPEGTWAAAARELAELAGLGITVIEMMPVAEFPGRFGWGYDGVALFAPSRLYGTPDDLRAFIDTAHALGVGVILDVVYNHFGPDGCYLRSFAPEYFAPVATEWGAAINFDGPGSGPVREFFLANVEYWIREFHFDGYRFDATQNIQDTSPVHIMRAMVERARVAGGARRVLVTGENEPQQVRLVQSPAAGGYGFDALWNDDFHHSAMVALTGRTEAYYGDYRGSPQELISAARWGFLFQGQWYAWQRQQRGTPALDLDAGHFINFLQNHDQIANTIHGQRVTAVAGAPALRALTALLLLTPGHVLLFQGQEFAATAPFTYFADHEPAIAQAVRRGRRAFLAQFPSIAAAGPDVVVPDPAALDTFVRCKLDLRERREHAGWYELHRDLIHLARHDPTFKALRRERVHGAVLHEHAFLLRFLAGGTHDRLVLVNLGASFTIDCFAEPLLAPPAGMSWSLLWSSDDIRYGGAGTPPVLGEAQWQMVAHATLVLTPSMRAAA